MKVLIKSLTDEKISRRDERDAMSISIDGKEQVSFYDGESEDNSLMRNFSDVFDIPELMRMAYEAGKNGETFESEHKKVEYLED